MIPDPIEQMENRIYRMVDDLEIVGDSFICPYCGQRELLALALPAGPWPDAMPICRACAEALSIAGKHVTGRQKGAGE